MRALSLLDVHRRRDLERSTYGMEGDDFVGLFRVKMPKDGRVLNVIASNDAGWDHVSVSLPDRCPTWAEMDHIKRLFFRDEETAFQLHVPPADHINDHPHCLHLWRPHAEEIPLPPSIFV